MNKSIGIGVLWNLASVLVSRGATTIFTLFLARLLVPEAFGLIAMATVVFELANVFVQSGLGQALIRSKEITQLDLSTVFFSNLMLSFVTYGLLYLAAPSIANFYSQPDLSSVIRITGVVVILNAVKVVQIALLSRHMNFRAQMRANVLAVLLSGTLAIAAAYSQWGVWSLVIQMLTSSLISAIVLWLASDWRPTWQFSKNSFDRMFRFGRNLLMEGTLSVLYQNSYILVIGRFFSAEVTGLYFVAKKISSLVSQQLSGAVQQVTFPALAKLQDSDDVIRAKYRQIIQVTMFMIAPVMLLMIALAQPAFDVLFDSRWREAVPYLQLLCVVGVLHPLHSLNINILKVKNRTDLIFKIGLVKRGLNIGLLLAAIPFGMFAIVASQVVGSFIALIPNTYYSARLISYKLKDQVSDAVKPINSSILAAVASWSFVRMTPLSSGWLLFFGAIIGTLVYLVVSWMISAEGFVLLNGKLSKKLSYRT